VNPRFLPLSLAAGVFFATTQPHVALVGAPRSHHVSSTYTPDPDAGVPTDYPFPDDGVDAREASSVNVPMGGFADAIAFLNKRRPSAVIAADLGLVTAVGATTSTAATLDIEVKAGDVVIFGATGSPFQTGGTTQLQVVITDPDTTVVPQSYSGGFFTAPASVFGDRPYSSNGAYVAAADGTLTVELKITQSSGMSTSSIVEKNLWAMRVTP